jgi:8-oxo-dGTP pyrophosphatase MutT (NUDIX family)
MNFDPQKLFIGLIDFFSIIMPGALLAFFLKDDAAKWFSIGVAYPLSSAEAVTVFLFASYLLGHFAFLLGAVLDDWLYHPLRSSVSAGQVRELAKGKSLSPRWMRRLAASEVLFGKNADAAVFQAVRLKARELLPLSANEAINAFQWSKVVLARDHREGLSEVNRLEASSKFFRSFVVVLVFLGALSAVRHSYFNAVLSLIAVVPAVWRYADQRFKATQQAYWFLLARQAAKGALPPAMLREDGLTHAGGVVYKKADNKIEFLLVEASRNRKEFVLPKGHIEPGEDPRETAVREVCEEAGHWARVEHWLCDARLGKVVDAPFVRWFLMECVEEGKPPLEEERQGKWLSAASADKLASHPETRALLSLATKKLDSLERSSAPEA